MKNDPALALGVAVVRDRVGFGTLEERLSRAMRLARRKVWFETREEFLFRCAVGAVLIETKDEAEKLRIEKNVRAIRALDLIMQDVPVDLERVIAEVNEVGVLPLMRLWRESKDG